MLRRQSRLENNNKKDRKLGDDENQRERGPLLFGHFPFHPRPLSHVQLGCLFDYRRDGASPPL